MLHSYPFHDLADMHCLLQNLPRKRCPCLTNQEKESSRLKRLPEATRLARGKARTRHPLLQKNTRAGWQRTLNGRFWNVGVIKKKTEKQLLIFFLILKATHVPGENLRHCRNKSPEREMPL